MFPWAKFRRAKGGVKAHVLLDHDDYLPAYVLLTEAKRSDVKMADLFSLNPGSIVTMDRGYTDYALFGRWTLAEVFFVTRLKDNAAFTVETEFDSLARLPRIQSYRTHRGRAIWLPRHHEACVGAGCALGVGRQIHRGRHRTPSPARRETRGASRRCPERSDTNAIFVPSGEKFGRASTFMDHDRARRRQI